MQPYSLMDLAQPFQKFTKNIALYLPRTSDLNQLAALTNSDEEKVTAVHYCMEGASKVRKPAYCTHRVCLLLCRPFVYISGCSNCMSLSRRLIIRCRLKRTEISGQSLWTVCVLAYVGYIPLNG